MKLQLSLISLAVISIWGTATCPVLANKPYQEESWIQSEVNADILAESNWQIYQNSQFSFQLEYPLTYTLDSTYENEYPDSSFIHLYSNADARDLTAGKYDGTELPLHISISAYENPNRLSVLEWLEENTASSNFVDYRIGDYEAIAIDNREAIAYTWESLLGGFADSVAVTNNLNNSIIILTVGYVEESDRMRQDFQEILGTLQFMGDR